ncbi:MAG: HAMP domain-containing histidine kinase [Clostridia bacterium]|nr:HAMP domain-containing histidine kinase [Clostridia bacterium]
MSRTSKKANRAERSKTRDRRIQTGSIALRIALGSALFLLLAFVVVDLVVVAIEAWPQVSLVGRSAEGWQQALETCWDVMRSQRFDILLKIEGVIVLLRLLVETLRVRKHLKPLDEMARAAMDLSNIDVSLDERFAKLESAIDQLSPAAEDAAISTGDAELEGLESAVNKLVLRMRESYRQQARFVSDASHELRTPIAVIKGYADMLDRWGKEDESILEESIQAIKTESDSMQHLVEQLLFLARGDSGRTPVEMAPVSLSAMVKEVCEESAMIDEAHGYQLIEGPAVTATGDASLLKQTARILVQNAAKYSPEGTEIRLRAFTKDGRPAFSVEDEGIGMDGEAQTHMFERFYRADDSRARASGGSGLGLAIAKWIVDRHGGRFEVVSRKDIGTRISVIL